MWNFKYKYCNYANYITGSEKMKVLYFLKIKMLMNISLIDFKTEYFVINC